MKHRLLIFTTLLASTASHADPSVSGNTISWPDDGWYQVQSSNGLETFCSGGQSCDVQAGSYLVINHTTGQRFNNIKVGNVIAPRSDAITVTASTISWPDDGWYQVQDATSYQSVCEGGRSCDVENGTYTVINLTTGQRFENVVVGNTATPGISDVTVTGSTISWPNDGWYQVQDADTYASICQGGTSCNVPAGTYTVINLTTGKRFTGIQVSKGNGSNSLPTPSFQGDLKFSEITTVQLDPFLSEAGLHSDDANSYLARDGKSVRLDITDSDTSDITAIALANTDTADLSWLAKNISPKTRLLFDGNNKPVASVGIACQPPSYTPLFESSLVDISNMIPEGRCISSSPQMSANGNVLIFSTYDPQTGTEYLAPESVRYYAYTLDTGSLAELPMPEVDYKGKTLSAKISYWNSAINYLSDDGSQYFSKAWWKDTNANGRQMIRKAGAVLWDTATGDSQVRGLSPDDVVDCTITGKIACDGPYSYVMSHDGKVQYSEVPSYQPPDPSTGSIFSTYSTFVEQTITASPTPYVLPEANNASPTASNYDGSLLLLHLNRSNGSMPAGYNLYQVATGTHVSLNRALNTCPEKDEQGNTIDADSCQFTSVPSSITNNGESFVADGNSVVLQSVSRYNDQEYQNDSFILDVDTGAMYAFPDNYSPSENKISADASVFLWQSSYPEYNLLIGKR